MIVKVGQQTMSLLVTDDLADDATVLEYRAQRADVKPVFAMIVPEKPSRNRSVITFDDMSVEHFLDLLADARSQPLVAAVAGVDTAGETVDVPRLSDDPSRTPGFEWCDGDEQLLVTVWAPPPGHGSGLWIRVWREVPPRAAEKMVEFAQARLVEADEQH